MTVGVKYSCVLCGLMRVSFPMQARGSETVIEWMEKLLPLLEEDHRRRSPSCRADNFTEVMIPVTGTEKVGGPVLQ